LLFQAWAFIAPGLMPNEKRLAGPLIIAGSILFPVGAIFAYYLLDVTLYFLAQFAVGDTAMQNDAQAYISFALTMMIAFGAVFEFPLLVVLLTRVGIVSTEWLAKRRAHIFIFQLIVSAIVTPTGDPVTLLSMALPLQILFEIALLACRFLDRLSARDKEEAEANQSGTTDGL
ncbi:MAG: twin-arginine translocase subunit TatC, partial [Candidatus Sumerlaeota bacterium]